MLLSPAGLLSPAILLSLVGLLSPAGRMAAQEMINGMDLSFQLWALSVSAYLTSSPKNFEKYICSISVQSSGTSFWVIVLASLYQKTGQD